MLNIVIPSRGVISLEYMVLDVNGTIALDGQMIPGVDERLDKLGELLGLWLVSADTQGTLASLGGRPPGSDKAFAAWGRNRATSCAGRRAGRAARGRHWQWSQR